MSAPDRIYLQPECCAGPEGRLWCGDPDPEDCDDGNAWVEYVRADRRAESSESVEEPGSARHCAAPGEAPQGVDEGDSAAALSGGTEHPSVGFYRRLLALCEPIGAVAWLATPRSQFRDDNGEFRNALWMCSQLRADEVDAAIQRLESGAYV